MEKYENMVIMARIQEIEREQLSWLDYLCDKFDYIIDEQRNSISVATTVQEGKAKVSRLYMIK